MTDTKILLKSILSEALGHQASDIHILGSGEVFFRVAKNLLPASVRLDRAMMETIQKEILDDNQIKQCTTGIELDTSVEIDNVRLRIHAYLTRSLGSFSIRILPQTIPTMDELGLPSILKEIFSQNDGLILVSGATGSGKSTSIAAALEYVNQHFSRHIVCIEDPVEYLHQNAKSFFSYREIGKDSVSFDTAIRASLREDPDIVFIGELRSFESIKSALLCAQTGHLVVASTHAQDAASTIARIVHSAGSDRAEIASELAFCLRAIISQKLLPISEKQLRGIFEVLLATPAVKTLIRDQKFHQIPSQIAMGREFGMMSFEESQKTMPRGICPST
ncbi:PilT/PilU family type 4a pilus ATPase [Helicobacter sp. 11S02596-1]|uniref:type IV pilus twitching motility protein PilT n=1 Tax=Helicobacter sp. 11S02596-1 TaxID=1476194 RepID=UPI000BA6B5CE|nr:PilT/PilU family type 4a pilus ATPase [Helicobacter sp. 11S02596-1]PAF44837.1 hypothetical protein BJI48_02295 [Helicobacter sp. 11S02596-1]